MVAVEDDMSEDDKKPNGVAVQVTRRRLTRDPEIHVFFLRLSDADGLREDGGYGSEAEAVAWLRGAAAMARMLGRDDIRIPDVPGPNEAKD